MNWSLIPCLNQSHTSCCAIVKTNCYSNFIGWCGWMETYKLTGWPLDSHWKFKVYIKLSLTTAHKNSFKSFVSLGKKIRLRLFYLKCNKHPNRSHLYIQVWRHSTPKKSIPEKEKMLFIFHHWMKEIER